MTRYLSKTMALASGSLVALFSGLGCQGAEAFLKAATPAEYAAAFTDRTGDWKAGVDGFEGRGPLRKEIPGTEQGNFFNDAHTYFVVKGVNLWRYAFAGDANWKDYSFETTVKILDTAPLDGIRPGQDSVFINYQWGREAIGSDVGIVVRYQSQDRYYMVRLSTAYQHVELWKTKGGVVCVKPFPFKANTDYRVAVSANGPWITVALDGQEILKYADAVEPILNGKVGVGVRESRVVFSNASVNPVTVKPAVVPPHLANFHMRDWIGRLYIFDGDEPVAHIDQKGVLQEMKMVPGLMPMILNDTVASWGCLNFKEERRLKITKEGETLAFSTEKDDKDGRCKGYGDWTLTYDPAVGYIWDVRKRVEVLVDGKIEKWNLNLADPCIYQDVAPATDKLPPGRSHPNYALYLRTDGKYGYYPVNHQFKNDNFAKLSSLIIKKGGFIGTTVDDWAFVVELPEDNEDTYWGDFCAWGLDQHVAPLRDLTNSNKFDPAAKGDVYKGHARFHALTPERVQQILKEGVLPDDRPENHRELLAHVEPVNNFTDIVQAVAGDSKIRWMGNYSIDKTVGRNDTISMRLENKSMATLDAVGPSFRSGPYLAPKYRIGFWVKADAFKGRVTLRVDNITFEGKRAYTNPEASAEIVGQTDWKFVGFETDFPHFAHFWKLTIDVQGVGVVWVDDFEISPLSPISGLAE